MKKLWEKPAVKIVSCNVCQIQGDVVEMPEDKLREQLKNCGYPLEKKYRANPNYVLREIAGEAVLVSVGDGIADFCGIVTLNPSAKILWTCLLNGAGRTEISEALVNEFGISKEKAEEDAERALCLLKEHGMIYDV